MRRSVKTDTPNGTATPLRLCGSILYQIASLNFMYNENDGQHPSLNTFYQLVTMFDISVDQYFYPSKNTESSCRKRINAMLNSLDEKDLQVVEATIQALKNARETEVK